jgi:hypothetical protein
MIAALQQILEKALERLAATTVAFLPPLLAAGVIFFCALLIATLLRWSLGRIVKAKSFDRFMIQSGIADMMGRSGRVAAGRLVAQSVYWLIVVTGLLTALTAFNTSLTSRIIEAAVLLMPRLLGAAAILLAGVWLSRYLGRGTLVWACNEGLPHARYAAAAVRMLVIFVAAVVAADQLEFARTVFLAAFVLMLGGAVLAVSIAAGIGLHGVIERRFREFSEVKKEDRSIWSHL